MYKHMKKDFKGKRDKTCETNKLKKKKKKQEIWIRVSKQALAYTTRSLHTQDLTSVFMLMACMHETYSKP